MGKHTVTMTDDSQDRCLVLKTPPTFHAQVLLVSKFPGCRLSKIPLHLQHAHFLAAQPGFILYFHLSFFSLTLPNPLAYICSKYISQTLLLVQQSLESQVSTV